MIGANRDRTTAGMQLAVDFGRYGAAVFGTVMLLLVASSAIYLWLDYQTRRQETERRLEMTAEAVATHVRQTITFVDLTLESVDDDKATPEIVVTRPRRELHDILRRAQALSPVLYGLGIAGPDGKVFASATSPNPQPADLSDRDFFARHRDNPGLGLIVSRPVMSRPENVAAVPVSRRIATAEGSFAGFIAARLDPKYFLQFFATMGADVVAVYGMDGSVIARFPEIDLVSAPPVAASHPLMALSGGAARGGFAGPSPVDGVDRLIAFRVIEAPKLVVAVEATISDMRGAWLVRRYPFFVLLAGGLVMLVIIAALVQRQAKATNSVMAATAAARASAERAVDVAEQGQLLAQQAQRQKSEFLAHMSHELRTPLNAMMGFSDMMIREAWGGLGHPKYVEYAKDIHLSAQHLLALVNDVLDLSKIEAGKWDLRETEVRLADLIDSVIHLGRQRALAEGVQVTTLMRDAATAIRVDERTMRQAVLNLLINAVKFAGDDRKVEVEAGVTPDGEPFISVRDRGIGMSQAEVDRVVEPYESTESARARGGESTGLGLPITKAFVELHGGRLAIRSAPGVGTTVTILLPAGRLVGRDPRTAERRASA